MERAGEEDKDESEYSKRPLSRNEQTSPTSLKKMKAPTGRSLTVSLTVRTEKQQTLSSHFRAREQAASSGLDDADASSKRAKRGINMAKLVEDEEDPESPAPQPDRPSVLVDASDGALVSEVLKADARSKELVKAKAGRRKKTMVQPLAGSQSRINPEVLTSAVFVFFRPAGEDEDERYIYCKVGSLDNSSCHAGKVLISAEHAGQRLRSENCKSHVVRFHNKWWKTVEQAGASQQDVTAVFETLMTAASTSVRQQTMGAFIKRERKKEHQVKQEVGLMHVLISNNIAFNMIGSSSWKTFQKLIGIDLASRPTIFKLLVPMYLTALAVGEREIVQAGAYSIGFDYWTSVSKDKYLAITYHYADENMIVHSRLLDLVPCKGSAMGSLTKQMVDIRLDAHFEKASKTLSTGLRGKRR